MSRPEVASRLAVSGGYDMEPEWLPSGQRVVGTVAAWLPRPDRPAACLLRLDCPLTSSGLAHGQRVQRTGDHLVLSLRYVGQEWGSEDRTVQVSLCAGSPEMTTFEEWTAADLWVESHATYAPASE
jgi:hypothetical protein